MMNTILRILGTESITTKKLNASITVEASLSFTLTIFILFLMLSPLLIIKTSSDVLITLNEMSKKRCSFEIVKQSANDISILRKISEYIDNYNITNENINLIEGAVSYALMAYDFVARYGENEGEYKNIDSVYDLNPAVYNEDNGLVRYDYYVKFKLPYNLLHIQGINKRLLICRRAFIGSIGNRFDQIDDSGEYVYVANNYVNSSVYHTYINCTYLIKKTEMYKYKDVKDQRNENNEKYTKCTYCFRKIRLKQDTSCYVTQYGDKFHYRSNCPLMTAYVSKIPKEYVERYNLRECSKCSRRGE